MAPKKRSEQQNNCDEGALFPQVTALKWWLGVESKMTKEPKIGAYLEDEEKQIIEA